nr:nitronate monooxygenase [Phaeovibrio sulfidiphilus]
MISGKEVLPLVEGGKGLNVSTGRTSGAWAAAGAVGTVSAVNADSCDEIGAPIPEVYHGKTRRERQAEMIAYGIRGGISQVQIAHEVAAGEGRIHINVLWEMGGAEAVLEGVLEGTPGLVHGITCGAGMPYKVSEIAARHNVYYYPIVSSDRAFRALWRRSYSKTASLLGGVVYEDPWRAGGHNGLSNTDNPLEPQNPMPRVLALRRTMRELGTPEVPIVMAGGVWYLREWADWIDNPDLGPIAFQFGTRPLLVEESPVASTWRPRLMSLKPEDIYLHRFSPTGFYSSAVKNRYLKDLVARSERQVPFSLEPDSERTTAFSVGSADRELYLTPEDMDKVRWWVSEGHTEAMRTPDDTLVFVTPETAATIRQDQRDCMGCLSHCMFSNWAQNEKGTTGHRPDPRSFCIQKTLRLIAHGGSIEDNLMFAGHAAFRFAGDPAYANGRVPTMKELVEQILAGD